jgi:Zn-dependent M28 family amino/carboxypeptidase
MSRTALVVLAVSVTVLAACGRPSEPGAGAPSAGPSEAAQEFAAEQQDSVTIEAMMAHLGKLQEIADNNDGNRALGTKGYDASVDYVAGVLRDSGFDVTTDEFDVRLPFADEPAVTVGGAGVKAAPLNYTIGTPPEGLTAPLTPARVDDTPGCTAADYDGLPVDGAVVLVDRGACPFGVKQQVAAERGAVAMIVANNSDDDQFGGTLGEDTDVLIPVVGVTKSDGARLRENPGTTTIKLKAGVNVERTRNVVAQTKTGSTANVVMAGAHLDSVPEGPGINDNGSGVAALLETAVQLGSSPDVRNAVRFGFWGAEEMGLVGSNEYIAGLDVEQLKDIALYLNFDMLGSPNPGYFTYDGNQSTQAPDNGVPRVPEGSAGIERTLMAYLEGQDKTPADTDFDGRSDYDAFTLAGIPAGGLFAGAEEKKSPEEAELWGGKGEQPFDPNYHKPGDTIENIDRTALEIQGRGVAYTVGLYAQDEAGRNGVPIREDRTRHAVTEQ